MLLFSKQPAPHLDRHSRRTLTLSLLTLVLFALILHVPLLDVVSVGPVPAPPALARAVSTGPPDVDYSAVHLDPLSSEQHGRRPAGDVVERFWRADLHGPACVVGGVCARFGAAGLEELWLPGWMADRPAALEGCRLDSRISYYSDLDRDGRIHTLRGDIVMAQMHTIRNDLFYAMGVYEHFPHWLGHATSLLDLVDIVLGAANRQHVRYEKHCRTAHPSKQLSANATPDARELRDRLNPAIFVHDRVVEEATCHRWMRSFLEYLFHSAGGVDLLPVKNNKASVTECFQSLVVPARQVPQAANRDPAVIVDDHTMFVDNGLVKRPRVDLCKSNHISVVLLNRDITRHLVNVEEVHRVVTESLSPLYANVSFHHVTFDHAAFPEQVQTIQMADIVISPHGAGIANAFFLRRRSLVIEVFPFGYFASLFQAQAHFLYYVDFTWLVSPPDMKTVVDRINDWNESDSMKNRFKSAFERASGVWSDDVPTSWDEFRSPESDFIMTHAHGRGLLRSQAVRPVPAQIARRITEWYQARCPV